MFGIKFRLNSESRRFLQGFSNDVQKGLRSGIRKGLLLVQREAKMSFGKPDHLKVITGYLRSSINFETKIQGNKVIGEIGSNVVYSRIHEFGGNAGPGRQVYLRPRPYIFPAIENNLEAIFDKIGESIRQSVERS